MGTGGGIRVRISRLRESGNLCLQSDRAACKILLTQCINWPYLSYCGIKASLGCEPELTEWGGESASLTGP